MVSFCNPHFDPQTTDVVEWWRGKSIYDDDGGPPHLDHLPNDRTLRKCERVVLGCLIVNGEALRMVDDLLEPETFLWPGHGRQPLLYLLSPLIAALATL
jgi:hypothetical protein